MDKHEKLAVAREIVSPSLLASPIYVAFLLEWCLQCLFLLQLEKFQSRNSPLSAQKSSPSSLSSQSTVTHSIKAPLSAPTPAGVSPSWHCERTINKSTLLSLTLLPSLPRSPYFLIPSIPSLPLHSSPPSLRFPIPSPSSPLPPHPPFPSTLPPSLPLSLLRHFHLPTPPPLPSHSS